MLIIQAKFFRQRGRSASEGFHINEDFMLGHSTQFTSVLGKQITSSFSCTTHIVEQFWFKSPPLARHTFDLPALVFDITDINHCWGRLTTGYAKKKFDILPGLVTRLSVVDSEEDLISCFVIPMCFSHVSICCNQCLLKRKCRHQNQYKVCVSEAGFFPHFKAPSSLWSGQLREGEIPDQLSAVTFF